MDKNNTDTQEGQEKQPTAEEILATLPKDSNGTVIVGELTTEQRAVYYEHRSNEQARGFNEYKVAQTQKEKELQDELNSLRGKKDDGEGTKADDARIEKLEKTIETLQAAVKEDVEERGWKKDFGGLTAQENYKVLEKREKEFKEFAYKPENVNTPIDILADAYIIRNKLNEKKEERRGTDEGGAGVTPKTPGVYTADEVRRLRENNYEEYVKLLRQGKLKIQD